MRTSMSLCDWTQAISVNDDGQEVEVEVIQIPSQAWLA